MPRRTNTLQSIKSHSIRDDESGCLLYMGYLDKDGYPNIQIQGKMYRRSHIVYRQYYGDIPEGHEIDHICYVRHCLEPTHLRALTHRENVLHSKTNDEKRHRRLKQFLDAYPHVQGFPVLLTLDNLEALWNCGCTGNVKNYLLKMSDAFQNEFCYEPFATGRGSKPALYAIGIHPSLIDKLSNEDEQRETPVEDILTLVA